MDYLLQKVAYLKGLTEGLGVDDSTKEGKVLVQIIETLEAFTNVLEDVIDDQADLEEYVNFIDEDLADVEEDFYGDDDDDFDYDDFDDEDYDYDDYLDCCDDEECDCHCEEDEE
jgi:hypothetical protein